MNRDSVNANHQDNLGQTAVSCAVREGELDAPRELMQSGRVDVNLPDSEGLSPWIWVAQTARLLPRNKRARAGAADGDLRGAISWACQQGYYEVLLMLIKYRCPGINEKDIDQWRPMMWTMQCNVPESIGSLNLMGEIDLEAADDNGKTALWWAVNLGQIRNVRVLLREGKDPKATDKDGV